MEVSFRQQIEQSQNMALRDITGMPLSKSIKLALFQTADNASWAADRYAKKFGYPAARFQIRCNRDAFALEVGDAFRLTYEPYGISELVCRVEAIQEESIESEEISITAVEDLEYTSNIVEAEVQESYGDDPNWELAVFTHVAVFEAAYAMSGEVVAVIPCVERATGGELGYQLHMSVDGGDSYTEIATVGTFNAYGTLVSGWPSSGRRYGIGMYQFGSGDDIIPEEEGIIIDFPASFSVANIDSITRVSTISGVNMGILGNELIAFQNITAVDGYDNRYELTGVYRGRLDTLPGYHGAGEDFWFVGSGHREMIQHYNILAGSTRQFKMVPFNSVGVGDISDAIEVEITFEGRAFKPYIPSNFRCFGRSFRARYPGTTTSSTTTSTTTTTA